MKAPNCFTRSWKFSVCSDPIDQQHIVIESSIPSRQNGEPFKLNLSYISDLIFSFRMTSRKLLSGNFRATSCHSNSSPLQNDKVEKYELSNSKAVNWNVLKIININFSNKQIADRNQVKLNGMMTTDTAAALQHKSSWRMECHIWRKLRDLSQD